MTMMPLDPRQLSVLRIRALLTVLLLLAALFGLDAGPLRQTPLPFGVVSGSAALLLILWGLWSPGRRYRSWAYNVQEEELHIQHGLWTKVRTIVPFGRVQHIDVSQGPIERQFGIGRIILHTAGTRGSAVALPGLAFQEAGRLRDLIRSHIRQDLG